MTEPWSYAVGQIPYAVTAYERPAKSGVVYLRWRATTKKGRNWVHRSLGFAVRDAKGRLDRERERAAKDAAARQLAELLAGLPMTESRAQISLEQGRALAFDRETGKYPTDSAHRREVDRALQFAMAILGPSRTWDTIKQADLRRLWRKRIEQLAGRGQRGHRGAQVTIARLLAVAEWLRGEERIPSGACVAPRHWKQQLAEDWRTLTEARSNYEPERPRHTLAEMRKILAAGAGVDPRFALLLALGAELRLGQVVRARREDLMVPIGKGVATFQVHAKGKKRGVMVKLTAGQTEAVVTALTGYLSPLELAGGDYPLFPQGQLAGGRSGKPQVTERHRTAKPVNRRTLEVWFQEAEEAAGVTHLAGRGLYGLRRAGVDAAKAAGISREGLKEHGGWVDSQMPDMVYADQEAEEARDEARLVRAKIRGEK